MSDPEGPDSPSDKARTDVGETGGHPPGPPSAPPRVPGPGPGGEEPLAPPPAIRVPPPGPASRALLRRLREVESRNVTFVGDEFPVAWRRARGTAVEDADGNVYLDFTGAFGVAVAGHGHPRITRAIREQAGRLVHGMGDVHPPVAKVELLEALARRLPWGGDTRTVLASAGSEAVEVALKTALLATGRPEVVAFEGGYHGLTAGALAATAREDFRAPFLPRLYPGVRWVPFPQGAAEGFPGAGDDGTSARGGGGPGGAGRGSPGGPGDGPSRASPVRSVEASLEELERALGSAEVGAVIVEPIQGRAGVRIPPPGFLAEVGRLARRAGALLVFDEVFTGLGRTGRWFAAEYEGVEPDLICLGKALGGGLPLSACAGPRRVMEAWPDSEGEALHTSTFLGHPLACAASMAVLETLEQDALVEKSARSGALLLDRLRARLAPLAPRAVQEVRGRGLFAGIELTRPGAGAAVAAAALRRGLLVLPAGDDGRVVELSPPLVVDEGEIDLACRVLGEAVEEVWEKPAGGGGGAREEKA